MPIRLLAALACTLGLLDAAPRVEKLSTPLRFEPNLGQADSAAPFVARGPGYRLLLTGNQTVLAPDSGGSPLRMTLAGALSHCAATPQDPLPSVSNYYIGSDPKNWHANVPNYGRVKFDQVYPGIDVVYYGDRQTLDYDLIVAPGADPSRIRWTYRGADSIRLDASGDLVFSLAGREIRQRKPTIYQETAHGRREVRGEYRLAHGAVRLALGAYDRATALVIDPPVIVYSTYLGGSGNDAGTGSAIAVDSNSNAYITGNTTGSFPTLSAYQSAAGNSTNNAFAAKFNASGTLVYSTYLSGSAESDGFGIAADSNGNAYITGRTAGNFPLMSPEQNTYGGGAFDAFVAKLNSSGGLTYSTYLGGSTDDEGVGIALDASGNMYLTGFTDGGFPTLNAAQATFGGGAYNGFVVKLTAAGALSWSTYLGGSVEDQAYAVAVDSNNFVYVVGLTYSSNFPTMKPLQSSYGGNGDAFLTEYSLAGVLQYSTYLGGPNYDVAYGVAVDTSGEAYVTGTTAGGFPTVNAEQPTFGGAYDAFAAKFNSTGSALVFSTYLGGSGTENGFAIAIDSSGDAYIAGSTSGGFPVFDASQTNFGGGATDAFVAELNNVGGLVYATYLGGAGADVAIGIAVDPYGYTYVSGEAGAGFPTSNAYQSTFGGGATDAFVTKLGPAVTPPTIVSMFPDTALVGGPNLTLQVGGFGFVSGAVVYWNSTALSTTFVNIDGLTASVPAALLTGTGTAQITVTIPGPATSNPFVFHVVSSPVVPSLTSAIPSPSQTCSSGATSELLYFGGAGFQSGLTIYWNGTALQGQIEDINEIYIAVPANLVVPGNVTITASNGSVLSNGVSFTVPALPTLTNFSPNVVPVGSASVLLTATGTNFASSNVLTTYCSFGPINFGSLTQTVTGTTEIQLTIPAADLTTAGTYYPFVYAFGPSNTGYYPSNSLAFTVSNGPVYTQQGSKLVGTGAVGTAGQGESVALSTSGNTAIIGGYQDSSDTGAAWVFTRSSGSWTQQGGKLVGTGSVGISEQGWSVALSGDGNTAAVGGFFDNGETGAVWIFAQSGGVWSQQGGKLVGTGALGAGALQGVSVALSNDGNTLLVGGYFDNTAVGAAWVFTRTSGIWTQQGGKLLGTGAVGQSLQGIGVALSADGNTAAIGGDGDNSDTGAVWIFTRSGGVWTQQGSKLVGTGAAGAASQGTSVSLSGGGNTLIEGGQNDGSGVGAAWVFTRSNGVWTQQGSKLAGTGATGNAVQGYSVSLSGDGNTAAIGGQGDNSYAGATWLFTRSGGTWSQLGSKLIGTGSVGSSSQGNGVAISGDSTTLLVGGPGDNSSVGAAWVFNTSAPAPAITTLSPTSTTAGGTAFTLTVNGTNFLYGAVVDWNGTALATTFVSNTQLTATVPANLIASAGTANITVVNDNGGTTSATSFTVAGGVGITGPAFLPGGFYLEAYSGATVTASGGQTPYIFSQSGIPTGLSLSPTTGQITGSPSVIGAFSFRVTATDFNGASASQTLQIVISPVVTINCTENPVNFTFTIGGGPQLSTVTCSVTSSPSALGLSFSAVTSSGGNWLIGSLSGGATPATLTISDITLGLAAGTYSGDIVLTVNGASITYTVPVTLTVTGSSQVTFSLTAMAPSPANFTAASATGTASLTLSSSGSTAWIAETTATWLHITSPASPFTGSGAATIGYSVDANTGSARTGAINICTVVSGACGVVVATLAVNQFAVSCTSLTVSPTSFTFASGGGSGMLILNTSGCSWSATTNNSSLITGLPATNTTGTIPFGVAAGAAAASGTITVNTTPPTVVTVTRTALICTYTISTTGAIGSTASFLSPQGSGSVSVTAPASCSWTASAPPSSFVNILSGATGSGNGTVTYSVAQNPTPTNNPARTAVLTIAGIPYTITQDPQGPQNYTCTVNFNNPPIPTLRAEGLSELAGDVVMGCSGFSLGHVTGDILVTLNTSLTNHTLNSDPSGQTTDALVLMDQPVDLQALQQQSSCPSGSGSPATVRGVIAGPQAVRFPNVALAPDVESEFCHTFRITNVRLNANQLGASTAPTETVSLVSASKFAISGATQTVGSVQQGIRQGAGFVVGTTSPAPIGEAIPVTFTENFATAFRPLVAANQNPSTAGAVYNSESGYVNSAVLGADTGFATNGTRLVVRLSNLPAGASVFASVTQTSGTATAQLESADTNGSGGSPMQSSAQAPGYQPVTIVNGAGTVAWEITGSNATSIDTAGFTLLVSVAGLTLQNTCSAGSVAAICGELGPQVAVSAPSNTAPVPRFVNPSTPASSQLTMLSIAPNPLTGSAGLAGVAAMRPMALRDGGLPARRAAAAVPAITVTGNTIMVGGTVTIGELLQSNTTSALANGACVGTTLPPSYTITACAADNGGTCSPTGSNSVSTCYPSIDPGQLSNITVIADTTMTGSAELAANVTSDSGNFAANGAGAFAETVTPAPGPSVALTLSGSPVQYVPAGQPITYNLSVNNSGAGPTLAGDPITVGISLPNLTGISIAAPSWNCIQTGFTVTCTYLGAVTSPGSAGFSVTGMVPLSTTVGSNIAASATLTFGGQLALPPAVTTGVIAPGPSAPTLSSPTNGAVVSAPVTLTWSVATGATSYTVYLGTSATQLSPVLPSTALTTYNLTGLSSGTKYYWYISAINSSGSTNSTISSFTVGSSCQFTLAGSAASLPSAGTATTSAAFPGGIYPENPITVGITPTAGTCTTYSATSSASWLSATFSGNSFAYTALSNAHLSTSQSATLTISNAGGGSQTFTVTEAPDTSEILTTRQVRALYESMLGRDPDSGGFTFWTGNGAAGLGQMGDNFLTSPEAFNSDFAVMAAYQAATGGPPTYAQFLTAAAGVRTGTQPVAQLFNSLIATNSSYSATTLYQNLLNRAPTSGGSGESAPCTAATLATCFEILIGFPSSFTPVITPNNEFQSTCGANACVGIDGITHAATGDHTNTMYVTMLYFVILDRDTDPSGLQFWIGIANMGGPGLQFQGTPGYFYRNQILGPGTPGQGFIGSPEFQGLFQ